MNVNFDWDGFKAHKFAVKCNTEHDARYFISECYKHGCSWYVGLRNDTCWSNSRGHICYMCTDNTLTWGDVKYCADNDIVVVTWGNHELVTPPAIKKVIFNNPATIVYWEDGSKTVVKSWCDEFDPEKGLAMACARKLLGNKGSYWNEFEKWLPEDWKAEHDVSIAR